MNILFKNRNNKIFYYIFIFKNINNNCNNNNNNLKVPQMLMVLVP